MNYHQFHSNYPLTRSIEGEKPILNDKLASMGINNVPLGVYADGLYVMISLTESKILTKLIELVFPESTGHVEVFSVDWMG